MIAGLASSRCLGSRGTSLVTQVTKVKTQNQDSDRSGVACAKFPKRRSHKEIQPTWEGLDAGSLRHQISQLDITMPSGGTCCG
jgi:hypothetical protein